MNKNRGYHVTVVDNKTGETVHDFQTRAIVCVVLDDIDESKAKEEDGVVMSCKIDTYQCIDHVRFGEMIGIKGGLEDLLQEITEDHPELERLEPLFDKTTIPLDDKDD